jgi:hypothetical protein
MCRHFPLLFEKHENDQQKQEWLKRLFLALPLCLKINCPLENLPVGPQIYTHEKYTIEWEGIVSTFPAVIEFLTIVMIRYLCLNDENRKAFRFAGNYDIHSLLEHIHPICDINSTSFSESSLPSADPTKKNVFISLYNKFRSRFNDLLEKCFDGFLDQEFDNLVVLDCYLGNLCLQMIFLHRTPSPLTLLYQRHTEGGAALFEECLTTLNYHFSEEIQDNIRKALKTFPGLKVSEELFSPHHSSSPLPPPTSTTSSFPSFSSSSPDLMNCLLRLLAHFTETSVD